ncbi:MAG: helix-turn-helix domain-containing protein [Myxococcales bacterium]|nr:helix-turn-helix domain-containing protein [Myxococcales bacterium]
MAKKITKVGRYRVEDASRPYTPGDELSLRQLAGYQRRAVRTVLRDVRNVEPEILRFGRKAIGLTQPQLAELFGVAPETVSRWETGAEPFKPYVQLALATLIDVAETAGGADLGNRLENALPPDGTITLKAS